MAPAHAVNFAVIEQASVQFEATVHSAVRIVAHPPKLILATDALHKLAMDSIWFRTATILRNLGFDISGAVVF